MKKLGAMLLCLLAFLCVEASITNADNSYRVIYVINDSSNLSDSGLAADLNIFEQAVNDDLVPIWNVERVHLVLQNDVNQWPPGAWSIDVRDYPGCWNCAGYHSVKGVIPYAVVATKLGLNWQIVFSHELFEMMIDPFVDRFSFLTSCPPFDSCYNYRPIITEICDPVPSFGYGFWLDGIRISDFAFPAWFNGQGGGKFDFTGFLKHARRVAKHGYIAKG